MICTRMQANGCDSEAEALQEPASWDYVLTNGNTCTNTLPGERSIQIRKDSSLANIPAPIKSYVGTEAAIKVAEETLQ